jgi:hypothetical protein
MGLWGDLAAYYEENEAMSERYILRGGLHDGRTGECEPHVKAISKRTRQRMRVMRHNEDNPLPIGPSPYIHSDYTRTTETATVDGVTYTVFAVETQWRHKVHPGCAWMVSYDEALEREDCMEIQAQ